MRPSLAQCRDVGVHAAIVAPQSMRQGAGPRMAQGDASLRSSVQRFGVSTFSNVSMLSKETSLPALASPRRCAAPLDAPLEELVQTFDHAA